MVICDMDAAGAYLKGMTSSDGKDIEGSTSSWSFLYRVESLKTQRDGSIRIMWCLVFRGTLDSPIQKKNNKETIRV